MSELKIRGFDLDQTRLINFQIPNIEMDKLNLTDFNQMVIKYVLSDQIDFNYRSFGIFNAC